MTPFLRDRDVPHHMKAAVVKIVLQPTATYGSEIWGQCRTLTDGTQNLVNRALRVGMGAAEGATHASNGALWLEWGLTPICALAAGAKMRAVVKARKLATRIKWLVEHPLKGSKRWTWVKGARMWFLRHCAQWVQTEEMVEQYGQEAVDDLLTGDPETWERVGSEQCGHMVRHAIALREREICQKRSGAFQTYLTRKYSKQTLTVWVMATLPRRASGVSAIMRMRTGAFNPVGVMAQWPPLQELLREWRYKCPCCDESPQDDQGESVQHILIGCRRWDLERRKHLTGVLAQAWECTERHRDSSDRMEMMAILLLGGVVRGESLESWRPRQPDAELAAPMAEGPPGQEGRDSAYRSVKSYGCMQVAAFLQSVLPKRAKALKAIHDGVGVALG
jgi:phage gp46-like protein